MRNWAFCRQILYLFFSGAVSGPQVMAQQLLQVGCPWSKSVLDQGLIEFIFIDRIVKRFSNIMLLRPGHWGTIPTRVLINLVKSHLVGFVYNAYIFEKQKTCLRSLSLASQMTTSSSGWLSRKVGRARKLKIPVDLTWKLENSELVVTWEARLGDCKLVFCFSKI